MQFAHTYELQNNFGQQIVTLKYLRADDKYLSPVSMKYILYIFKWSHKGLSFDAHHGQ